MPRIIVVDRDSSTREVVVKVLACAGRPARTAPDGQTALILHEEKAAALIILNIMLEEADGTATIRVIRQKDGKVPILALTPGRSGSNLFERAKELGAQGLLEKPFQSDELVAAVNRLLPPVAPGTSPVKGNM